MRKLHSGVPEALATNLDLLELNLYLRVQSIRFGSDSNRLPLEHVALVREIDV